MSELKIDKSTISMYRTLCSYKNKVELAAQRYMEEAEKQAMNQNAKQNKPIKLDFDFDSKTSFFAVCSACGGLVVRNFNDVPSSSDGEKVPVYTEICCESDCDYVSYIVNTMSRDGELIYNILINSPTDNADTYRLRTILLNKFLKTIS